MTDRHDEGFSAVAAAELERMRVIRRCLHREPEIGLDLPATQQVVLDALSGLGLETTTGTSLTSVTAVLRGEAPRRDRGATDIAETDAAEPVVLLRGDMDALPLTEDTGLPYASTNGAMHACGHDLHVAGLIGAARILAARRDEIPGTVVFMFQPGEEGRGGGRIMLEEGVLDAAGPPPLAAYAIHVDSRLPFGRFTTRPGPIMSGVSGLRMRISGTGGHAAAPHLAVDPVPVAAEIVLAIQSFTARRVAPHDPVVVSIGKIASDSAAGNVLARHVDLEANMRHVSPEALALVRCELPQMVRSLAAAHGCDAVLEFVPSYPATVNDADETAHVVETIRARHGEEACTEMPEPAMASEDFAYVLERVPGALVFLGARPDGIKEGEASPMHSATVRFDDDVLRLQAETLADLAWTRLRRHGADEREGDR
ncbi:MAG: M20 metallopeptidase family protein [Brevibacterium yomogidense]